MRGIQFDAESREAIIAGRKTQTRRVMTPQPAREGTTVWCWRNYHWTDDADISYYASGRCPYGDVGDVLYVKEHRRMGAADASLFIRLMGIRVERLQDIRYTDILAEGFADPWSHETEKEDGLRWFRARWDALNAKRGFPFHSNPWVWALTFESAAFRRQCDPPRFPPTFSS